MACWQHKGSGRVFGSDRQDGRDASGPAGAEHKVLAADPALTSAIKAQMEEGQTTIIEVLCTKELGDPFRKEPSPRRSATSTSTRVSSDRLLTSPNS
jgi:hypothetical protein